MKQWKAELSLVFVTFIWGATFLFTKIGLNDCTPSLYVILRFCVALIFSLIFFGKHFKHLNKQILGQGIFLGLLFGGGFLLQTMGLKYTSVSKSAFITGMTVVFTPFAFYLVERKAVALWQKIGVVVATIGLWLFTKPDISNLNLGDILTLFSTLFWALYITYMDVFTRGRTEFRITTQLVMLQLVAATPISIIYLMIFDLHSIHLVLTNNLLISLAYNGIVASFLLTLVHTAVQRYSNPVKASLIFSLEPVIASVIAVIVLSEFISNLQYIGGFILLVGVLTSETGEFLYNKAFQYLKKLFK